MAGHCALHVGSVLFSPFFFSFFFHHQWLPPWGGVRFESSDTSKFTPPRDRHVGLVVKASALRAEYPEFESLLRRDFFQGRVIPVATLPGAWCYRTGWPGVSILWLGEMESRWSATSISVWQHVKLSEQIRPWDTLACYWDIKQPTNNTASLSALQLDYTPPHNIALQHRTAPPHWCCTCHHIMPPHHATTQYHCMIPPHYITTQYHHSMSLHNTTALCRHTVSPHYTTTLCHYAIQLHDAATLYHYTIILHDTTAWYPYTISPRYTTTLCHFTIPPHDTPTLYTTLCYYLIILNTTTALSHHMYYHTMPLCITTAWCRHTISPHHGTMHYNCMMPPH